MPQLYRWKSDHIRPTCLPLKNSVSLKARKMFLKVLHKPRTCLPAVTCDPTVLVFQGSGQLAGATEVKVGHNNILGTHTNYIEN